MTIYLYIYYKTDTFSGTTHLQYQLCRFHPSLTYDSFFPSHPQFFALPTKSATLAVNQNFFFSLIWVLGWFVGANLNFYLDFTKNILHLIGCLDGSENMANRKILTLSDQREPQAESALKMVQWLTYHKFHSYATKSNQHCVVKTQVKIMELYLKILKFLYWVFVFVLKASVLV